MQLRRLSAVAAAATLALGVTACGDEDTDTGADTADTTTDTGAEDGAGDDGMAEDDAAGDDAAGDAEDPSDPSEP